MNDEFNKIWLITPEEEVSGNQQELIHLVNFNM